MPSFSVAEAALVVLVAMAVGFFHFRPLPLWSGTLRGEEKNSMKRIIEMLQLFAEGGEGASGGTNGTSDVAGQTETDANNVAENPNGDGLQTSDGGSESEDKASKPTLEERRKAYKEFIKANKDLYNEDAQNLINRRFKETRELQEGLRKRDEILDVLRAKYGTSELDELLTKVNGDKTLFRTEAEAAGLSDEEYLQRMQLTLRAERAERAYRESQEAEQRRVFNERLNREEAELKRELPEFSLQYEMANNPDFRRLVVSGVPVRHAYETVYREEINAAMIKRAQQDAMKAVSDNIRAKGNRVIENGAGGSAGVSTKTDVSKLTKRERAEMARRASMGEEVTFGS